MYRWDHVDSSCYAAVVALVCTQIQLLHRHDIHCYEIVRTRTTDNLVPVKSLSFLVAEIVVLVVNTVKIRIRITIGFIDRLKSSIIFARNVLAERWQRNYQSHFSFDNKIQCSNTDPISIISIFLVTCSESCGLENFPD